MSARTGTRRLRRRLIRLAVLAGVIALALSDRASRLDRADRELADKYGPGALEGEIKPRTPFG